MPVVVSDLQRWADLTLQRAGLPITPENEQTLYKWSRAEGGLNHNNPLNTTENWPGATLWNPQGVKTYPNLDVGASATAKTLTNGYYPDILSMFYNSVPTSQWSSAARAQISKWGTNTTFLGGGNVAPGNKTSQLAGASAGFLTAGKTPAPAGQSTGGNFLNLSIPNPLQAAGNAAGGAVGAAITGAEQSFAAKLLAAGEIAIGVGLMGLSAILLMLVIIRATGAAEKVAKVAGTPVEGAAIGRAVASSAARPKVRRRSARPAKTPPSSAPASSPKPITAGGREIKVTNPESRARLRQAGVEAA
jgi:hypothetical protein